MMWSDEIRGRMVKIEKKTKRYPIDLTGEEWAAMAYLMPPANAKGRWRQTDFRDILNAIRYMMRSGCEWRILPIHLPWQTAYWWFRRFVRRMLFQTIHDVALMMIDREREGCQQQPSVSQTLASGQAPVCEWCLDRRHFLIKRNSWALRSKSSGISTKALKSCRGDGRSSALSHGSPAIVTSCATMKHASTSSKP